MKKHFPTIHFCVDFATFVFVAMILTMAQQLLQLLLFFTVFAAVVQLSNNFFTQGAALREPVARAIGTCFHLGGYFFSVHF